MGRVTITDLVPIRKDVLSAFRKLEEEARSWHEFHHGTMIECDSICEALRKLDETRNNEE